MFIMVVNFMSKSRVSYQLSATMNIRIILLPACGVRFQCVVADCQVLSLLG